MRRMSHRTNLQNQVGQPFVATDQIRRSSVRVSPFCLLFGTAYGMIRQHFTHIPKFGHLYANSTIRLDPDRHPDRVARNPYDSFTCHGAATYWLYCEAFDCDPTIVFFSSDMFIQCQLMMGKLAKFGRVLEPPRIGSINLSPGTVLIFVTEHGHAGHTCIVNQNRKIAGYNQTGWFNPDTGLSHQFSIHNKRLIK